MKSNFFKVVLGNVLVLLVLLVVVELALRILNIGFGNTPLNPDPVFHHIHPSNYDFVSYSSTNEYEGHKVHLDEEGRVYSPDENKAENRPAVAFLGDSFTESLQVAWDSSFIGLLQAAVPGIKTQNYGVASYSPALHYLVAKHKIANNPPLPAKAFIMLYSNDIEDDRNYLKDGVFDGSNELTGINGGKPDPLVVLMRKSYLIRLLRKAQMTIKFAMEKPAEEDKPAMVVGNFIEQDPEWEGTESADYLLRTVRLLESKGVKVYVTVVPSKYSHFTRQYDGEELSEKVEKWAGQNNVSFIDLTIPFREWRAQHTGDTQKDKLFFEKDIHFNEKGHKIVANTLRPYLNN